jgi:hypothetical protein
MTAVQFFHSVNHPIAFFVIVELDILVTVFPPLFQFLDTAPSAATPLRGSTSSLVVGIVAPHFAESTHALAEVNVDSPVINQDRIHLGVGFFAALLVFKLNKGVLQAVSCLLVPDHLAAQDVAKAAKDEFQVLVRSDGIQFADEENVFRRLDLGKRQVAHHLKRQGLCRGFALPPPPLGFGGGFLIGLLVQQLLVLGNAHRCELGLGGRRRVAGLSQACRVWVRVIKDDCVLDPYVDQGVSAGIDNGIVDLLQHVESFHHLAENRRLAVEIVCVVPERN